MPLKYISFAVLSLMISSEVFAALPAGIPKTTDDQDKCFNAGEIDAKKAKLVRITVVGCENPIVQPSDVVESYGVYVEGGAYDVYDCELVRKERFGRLPTSVGLAEFIATANKHYGNPDDTNLPLCLVNTLNKWAKADAYKTLVGNTAQGRNIRFWHMGGWASVYLKSPVVAQMAKDLGKDDEILNWFTRRGEEIYSFANSTTLRNNHYTWSGHALAALGFATKNNKFARKGKEIFDTTLSWVAMSGSDPENKGWLPEELKRETKAVGYHLYVIQAMSAMIGLSKSVNCNFLSSDALENKLEALLRISAMGAKDPAVFKAKTGSKPNLIGVDPNSVESDIRAFGDDTQAMRVIGNVDKFLREHGKVINGQPMQLTPSSAANQNYNGGRLDYYREPGSVVLSGFNRAGVCD